MEFLILLRLSKSNIVAIFIIVFSFSFVITVILIHNYLAIGLTDLLIMN